MRGGVPLALSMLMLLAAPAMSHHSIGDQQLLLHESDPMPRWHSVIVEWEGTRKISGHDTILDPHGALVEGGEQPMWGAAVVFEFQRPDGSWRWFFALSGNSAAVGDNHARVTLRGPVEQDLEVVPNLRWNTLNNTFAWSLTGTTGRYRITTWAAGELEDGIYEFPLWGQPGVRLLAHNEGDSVAWYRADDHAVIAAGGAIENHGVWTRALATITHEIHHTAFVTDPTGNQFQTCACRYTGPPAHWDGSIRALGILGGNAAFAERPGVYQIDVIASQNNREAGIRGPLPPEHYNDALAWTFADVQPPDV